MFFILFERQISCLNFLKIRLWRIGKTKFILMCSADRAIGSRQPQFPLQIYRKNTRALKGQNYSSCPVVWTCFDKTRDEMNSFQVDRCRCNIVKVNMTGFLKTFNCWTVWLGNNEGARSSWPTSAFLSEQKMNRWDWNVGSWAEDDFVN